MKYVCTYNVPMWSHIPRAEAYSVTLFIQWQPLCNDTQETKSSPRVGISLLKKIGQEKIVLVEDLFAKCDKTVWMVLYVLVLYDIKMRKKHFSANNSMCRHSVGKR